MSVTELNREPEATYRKLDVNGPLTTEELLTTYYTSPRGSDDTAIQDALNQTDGSSWARIVIDPLDSGPYSLSSQISIPSKTVVTIREDIEAADGLDADLIRNVNYANAGTWDEHIYIKFDGGEIDGNKANQADNGDGDLIGFREVEHFRVDNGNFRNSKRYGVAAFACRDGTILNPTSHSNGQGCVVLEYRNGTKPNDIDIIKPESFGDGTEGGSPIWLAGVEDVEVDRPHIENAQQRPITIRNQDGAVGTDNVTVRDPTILHSESSSYNIKVSTDPNTNGTGTTDVNIVRPTIHSKDPADEVVNNGGISLDPGLEPVEDVTITEPDIKVQGTGILMFGSADASVIDWTIRDGKITTTNGNNRGILIDGVDAGVVNGTRIVDCTNDGIEIDETNRSCTNVRLYDGETRDNNSNGIQVGGDETFIHGWWSHDTTEGSTQEYGIYLDSGLSGVDVVDVVASGNTAGINDTARAQNVDNLS